MIHSSINFLIFFFRRNEMKSVILKLLLQWPILPKSFFLFFFPLILPPSPSLSFSLCSKRRKCQLYKMHIAQRADPKLSYIVRWKEVGARPQEEGKEKGMRSGRLQQQQQQLDLFRTLNIPPLCFASSEVNHKAAMVLSLLLAPPPCCFQQLY